MFPVHTPLSPVHSPGQMVLCGSEDGPGRAGKPMTNEPMTNSNDLAGLHGPLLRKISEDQSKPMNIKIN